MVVISGPSGVGKDAVLERMKASNVPYHFAVTATARPKRDDEVDGVDYIFVERDEFQRMIRNDELLEWAEVYGNPYGVPKSQVREALARGQDVILKIDVQGADNIRRFVPGVVYVFLAPPDLAELESRLTRRRTESTETLQVRLESAAKELEKRRSSTMWWSIGPVAWTRPSKRSTRSSVVSVRGPDERTSLSEGGRNELRAHPV